MFLIILQTIFYDFIFQDFLISTLQTSCKIMMSFLDESLHSRFNISVRSKQYLANFFESQSRLCTFLKCNIWYFKIRNAFFSQIKFSLQHLHIILDVDFLNIFQRSLWKRLFSLVPPHPSEVVTAYFQSVRKRKSMIDWN